MPIQDSPIRIILADAHLLMREGLRLLIESKPGMIIVGEAGDLQQALEVVTRTQPDIILLELNLGESTIEFIPELLTAAESARLVLVTSVQDAVVHYQAIEFGALGIVSKEQSADVLYKAIAKVHAGQVWLDRSTTADVLVRITRPSSNSDKVGNENSKIASLTSRERKVIDLLGQGLSNKAIATRLFLSEITVRHHLTSIFAKLEVSDRLELIVYAYRNHLAELPR